MRYDDIISKMLIDGDAASLNVGDLDWNADLLDQIPWNDIAGEQADEIMMEAFGAIPECDELHENEWLDVQNAWPAIPAGEVSATVARDADGDIDMQTTAERLDEALSQYLVEKATCIPDAWREQEITNLRTAYPYYICEDAQP